LSGLPSISISLRTTKANAMKKCVFITIYLSSIRPDNPTRATIKSYYCKWFDHTDFIPAAGQCISIHGRLQNLARTVITAVTWDLTNMAAYVATHHLEMGSMIAYEEAARDLLDQGWQTCPHTES
jgi:hypothetical protein